MHSPPQITPSPPEKPGRKQLLRMQFLRRPRKKLRAAGWREAKPEAEEVASPLDPLLQVMLANKDNLPEAVKEAFEEATAEPTVAPSVKGAQFSRKLSPGDVQAPKPGEEAAQPPDADHGHEGGAAAAAAGHARYHQGNCRIPGQGRRGKEGSGCNVGSPWKTRTTPPWRWRKWWRLGIEAV